MAVVMAKLLQAKQPDLSAFFAFDELRLEYQNCDYIPYQQ